MSTVQTGRRVANTPQPGLAPSSRNWLAEVSRQANHRPSSIIFFGPPGIGKTSLAAAIPGVVFLIDKTEDGINRLKEAGIVSAEIPVLPPASTFSDVLSMLETLRTGEHSFKALAMDALGGFERLCHEEVCNRDYGGQWGEKGFGSYQRGFDTSLGDWRLLIAALDRLRDERRMSIMLLAHAKISPFKNPEGPDFDRYAVDCHHKTWALTHKWADMVLFANYDVAFAAGESTKRKSKASGGQTRTMHTEYHAAFDAKNRHNLPAEIDMGNSGQEAWNNLVAAIKAGKQTRKDGE